MSKVFVPKNLQESDSNTTMQPTVYVLGAGASHFAYFPLASDLWLFLERELDRTTEFTTKEYGRQCRRLIEKFGGFIQEHRPTDLELIFTLVDLIELQGGFLGSFDFRDFDLNQARYGFARLVTEAFQGHSFEVRNCIHEKNKVARAWSKRVTPGDIVVSFNWDLLHEMILFKANKWHYKDGYGFPARGRSRQSRVLILKPHGSCNWALQHKDDPSPSIDHIAQFFDVVDSKDANVKTSHHGESLILPSYLKDPGAKPALHAVWTRTYHALRRAADVVVLGYSLPLADVPTRTMMSLALRENDDLDAITVVLADRFSAGDAYARWADFCNHVGKRIKPVYKTFEAFVLG